MNFVGRQYWVHEDYEGYANESFSAVSGPCKDGNPIVCDGYEQQSYLPRHENVTGRVILVFALSKKKGKGGSDADNERDPVPHEEPNVQQVPETEMKEDPDEYCVVYVNAPRRSGRQKRPVMEVV